MGCGVSKGKAIEQPLGKHQAPAATDNVEEFGKMPDGISTAKDNKDQSQSSAEEDIGPEIAKPRPSIEIEDYEDGNNVGDGNNADFKIVVEVCGAEDCCAMGSTAALLEIEELGTELAHNMRGSSVSVCKSGCLGLCGNGPSVAVSCKSQASPDGEPLRETFTLVNDPDKCSGVMNTAAKMCGHEPAERSTPSLMQRRANGMRWSALKDLGRHQKKNLKPGAFPATQLEEALQAEQRAATSDEDKDRAIRRAERLRLKIGKH